MNRNSAPPVDFLWLSQRLKVLAEPHRLLILRLLLEGARCNCELGRALQLAPNLISHHLRVLRAAGLIEAKHGPRDARWLYVSIKREALADLTVALSLFFNPDAPPPLGSACAAPGTLAHPGETMTNDI